MKKKAILFDLDGTLLPMDQEVFIRTYIGLLANRFATEEVDARRLSKAVFGGTDAMINGDGTRTNEEDFWVVFDQVTGWDHTGMVDAFLDFYRNDFNAVAAVCPANPAAADIIARCKEKGLTIVLATNPLFPRVATENRVRWAGLNWDDFAHITTFEESYFCKPNLGYYQEICTAIGIEPQDCVMVGNDMQEDMVASQLGIDCIFIEDTPIDRQTVTYPHQRMTLQQLAEQIASWD